MRSFARVCVLLLAAIALAATLFSLGKATAGLRLATADDVALTQGNLDPEVALSNRMNELQMGRFYVQPKYLLQEAIARVESDALHSAIRVGFFLTAVLAAAWFAYALTEDRSVALAVLLAGTGWLQVSVTYQPLLSYPQLWLAWTSLWMMGVFALRPESPAARVGLLLAFATALAMHEAASPFLLWPVAVRWAAGQCGGWREEGRRSAGCLIILAAYTGCYLWLRHAGQSLPQPLYVGGRIALVFDQALFALGVFSGGILPGLEPWLNRWGGPHDALLLSPSEWWLRLMTWSRPADYALAGLGALAFCAVIFPPREPGPRPGWRVVPLLVFALLAPILLLSVSMKYQEWSHQRMWPYYYSSMSYLAQIVLIVLGARAGLARIRSRTGRAAGALVCVLGAGVLTLSIRAVNRESEWRLRQHPFSHSSEYRAWLETKPDLPGGIKPGR